MIRVSALTLILLLNFGVGMSFSVCQGLMAKDCTVYQLADRCSSADFCEKMCRFGQTGPPALMQKKSPEILQQVCLSIVHTAQAMSAYAELVAVKSACFELAVPHQKTVPDVYLLNAAFLI